MTTTVYAFDLADRYYTGTWAVEPEGARPDGWTDVVPPPHLPSQLLAWVEGAWEVRDIDLARCPLLAPLAFRDLVVFVAGLTAWEAARADTALAEAHEVLALSRQGVDAADLATAGGYWAACVALGHLTMDQVHAIMLAWWRQAPAREGA